MANTKPNIQNPTDSFGKFLNKTNFKDLKIQKSDLYKIQEKMKKPNPKFTTKEWESIEGVINFINAIQDIAVDEYGVKETKVFRISRKDK